MKNIGAVAPAARRRSQGRKLLTSAFGHVNAGVHPYPSRYCLRLWPGRKLGRTCTSVAGSAAQASTMHFQPRAEGCHHSCKTSAFDSSSLKEPESLGSAGDDTRLPRPVRKSDSTTRLGTESLCVDIDPEWAISKRFSGSSCQHSSPMTTSM